MQHALSADDRNFRSDFESGAYPPGEFNHRAHVRRAYVYLCDYDIETAYSLMRGALLSFLAYQGVSVSKYHNTLTWAWIMAVRHFMDKTPACESSDVFIGKNSKLLDSRIMMTHYSADVLFSDEARARFVHPDRIPIPGK